MFNKVKVFLSISCFILIFSCSSNNENEDKLTNEPLGSLNELTDSEGTAESSIAEKDTTEVNDETSTNNEEENANSSEENESSSEENTDQEDNQNEVLLNFKTLVENQIDSSIFDISSVKILSDNSFEIETGSALYNWLATGNCKKHFFIFRYQETTDNETPIEKVACYGFESDVNYENNNPVMIVSDDETILSTLSNLLLTEITCSPEQCLPIITFDDATNQFNLNNFSINNNTQYQVDNGGFIDINSTNFSVENLNADQNYIITVKSNDYEVQRNFYNNAFTTP